LTYYLAISKLRGEPMFLIYGRGKAYTNLDSNVQKKNRLETLKSVQEIMIVELNKHQFDIIVSIIKKDFSDPSAISYIYEQFPELVL